MKNRPLKKSLRYSKKKNFNDLSSRHSSSMVSSTTNSAKLIEEKHFEKRHLDQSLSYFHDLLEQQLEIQPFGDRILSDSYKVIANINLTKHDYDQALIYYYKLLANEFDKKKVGDPSLAYIYKTMASIYYHQGNYEEALLFFIVSFNVKYKNIQLNIDR